MDNTLSFRKLAKRLGSKVQTCPIISQPKVRSVRRYIEDGATYLADLLATSSDASWCMDKYTAIFRLALANDNRMCLCGIMSAELDDLPVEVRAEIDQFARRTSIGSPRF